MSDALQGFLATVRQLGGGPGVFNPWRDADPDYDAGCDAPISRTANLQGYLSPRIDRARYLLVAEAAGYQGAKFSGIPLTSERIMLGFKRGIDPAGVMTGRGFRTSRPHPSLPGPVQQHGFSEPTASIVWGLLTDVGIDPYDVILWNIFPLHPYRPGTGRLTNRPPTEDELRAGRAILEMLRRMIPDATIIAIGEKAARTIGSCPRVRHPANGGAASFQRELPGLLKDLAEGS